MGNHSNDRSLQIINFIIEIGRFLNYYVDDEFLMSPNTFGGQAIDVAWFSEKTSTFPLFIFEIETTTNNSIANNPTKVFGKNSKVFEKPLFFFHIIIDGARNSEKYDDLLGLFGRHNYDIFRINNGELKSLIVKIISQHRRIRENLDLKSILRLVIDTPAIKSEIEVSKLIIEIENNLHETQKYYLGKTYANIACVSDSFSEEYLNFINRKFSENNLNNLSYEDYCQNITAQLINTGILYFSFHKEHKETNFVDLLNAYQNRHGHLRTIEYLPGLNYDYDVFIHDYVPYYLALAFKLFDDNKNAQEYLLELEIEILGKLPHDIDFIFDHHVSWALLMAASNSDYQSYYDRIRTLSNNKRKIYDTVLYDPVFKNDHNKRLESKTINIPSVKEYKENISKIFERLENESTILQIAIKTLSEDWRHDLDHAYNLGVDLANTIIKSW